MGRWYRSWWGWFAFVLVALVLVVFVQSRITQSTITERDVRPIALASPREARVPGLTDAMCGRYNSTNRLVTVETIPECAADPALLRALVIHGMITAEIGYSEELQRSLGEGLGLTLVLTEEFELHRGYDLGVFFGPQPIIQPGDLPRSILRRSVWGDASGDRLVFYELLWAPARDLVKERMLGCYELVTPPDDCVDQNDTLPNLMSRLLINQLLKENLLVDGFADATLALGGVGELLTDDLLLALCEIAIDEFVQRGFRDAEAPVERSARRCSVADQERAGAVLQTTRFVAITESLGSFFLMDGLRRLDLARATSDDEMIAREGLISFSLADNSLVYMFANQISLLNLARLSLVCVANAGVPCPNPVFSTEWPPEPIGTFARLIAFNDTNDLLGFELPRYLYDVGEQTDIINVSVRNTAFSIPWLFRSPAVHIRHGTNPAIIGAILNGFPLPADFR